MRRASRCDAGGRGPEACVRTARAVDKAVDKAGDKAVDKAVDKAPAMAVGFSVALSPSLPSSPFSFSWPTALPGCRFPSCRWPRKRSTSVRLFPALVTHHGRLAQPLLILVPSPALFALVSARAEPRRGPAHGEAPVPLQLCDGTALPCASGRPWRPRGLRHLTRRPLCLRHPPPFPQHDRKEGMTAFAERRDPSWKDE